MTKQEKELQELRDRNLALSANEQAQSFVKMDFVTLCQKTNTNIGEPGYKTLLPGDYYISSTKEVLKKLSVVPLAFIPCAQIMDPSDNSPKGFVPEDAYYSLTDHVEDKAWIKLTKEGFEVNLCVIVPVHILGYKYGEDQKAENTIMVFSKTAKKKATKWLAESKEIGSGDCSSQVWDMTYEVEKTAKFSWFTPLATYNAKATQNLDKNVELAIEITKKSLEKREEAKKTLELLAKSASFAITDNAGKSNSLDSEDEDFPEDIPF